MIVEKTIKEKCTNRNYFNDNYSYIAPASLEYLPEAEPEEDEEVSAAVNVLALVLVNLRLVAKAALFMLSNMMWLLCELTDLASSYKMDDKLPANQLL